MPFDLTKYDAILFDLDGVLTPTAELHMHAWRVMFSELFAEKGVAAYTDDDYFAYLDGKQRVEGVAGLLESRGIRVPLGEASDDPALETVNGIGNRKNAVFTRVLTDEGIAPYPGSQRLVDQLVAAGTKMAIVSSSKNARWVLEGAGLIEHFPVIVDGLVGESEGLPSKPAPEMFLRAAALLGVEPANAVVFEDAISGVAAGHAGHFAHVVGVDRGAGAAELTAAGADLVISDLEEFVQ